jgi:hypothetical protein
VGDEYIGKAVRWYYSTNPQVMKTGRSSKLPQSDGGRLIQVLPDDFAVPDDLDYDWYVNEAGIIINECGGHYKGEPFSGWFVKEGQKTAHYIAGYDTICGKVSHDRRTKWDTPEPTSRYCKECMKGLSVFD